MLYGVPEVMLQTTQHEVISEHPVISHDRAVMSMVQDGRRYIT